MTPKRTLATPPLLASVLGLGACTVGPDYRPPEISKVAKDPFREVSEMVERRRDKLQAFGLRHLRYVIAAADNGSFRKAAIAIGVQESAISRRIRDLEDEIGAALFIRSSSGVKLTHAGQLFIARARRALNQINYAATGAAVPYFR